MGTSQGASALRRQERDGGGLERLVAEGPESNTCPGGGNSCPHWWGPICVLGQAGLPQTTPCVVAMALSWLATSGQTPRSSRAHKQGSWGQSQPHPGSSGGGRDGYCGCPRPGGSQGVFRPLGSPQAPALESLHVGAGRKVRLIPGCACREEPGRSYPCHGEGRGMENSFSPSGHCSPTPLP